MVNLRKRIGHLKPIKKRKRIGRLIPLRIYNKLIKDGSKIKN